ncbi:hypothetical protein [Sphingomonas sp.]|uniref:hypothetical protein n=1 Tax=Sphingomonas sp. TaxID=28214 RepID=UPI002CB0C342|nr:hypothetical protein [Sphingomonas sp.]HWK36584.1 hypothetical protein [Sphingomonas sp.]
MRDHVLHSGRANPGRRFIGGAIHKLLQQTWEGIERLTAYQYAAPWRRVAATAKRGN